MGSGMQTLYRVMIDANKWVKVKRQTVDLRLKPSVTEKDDNVGR
jgi:hypothetical protein